MKCTKPDCTGSTTAPINEMQADSWIFPNYGMYCASMRKSDSSSPSHSYRWISWWMRRLNMASSQRWDSPANPCLSAAILPQIANELVCAGGAPRRFGVGRWSRSSRASLSVSAHPSSPPPASVTPTSHATRCLRRPLPRDADGGGGGGGRRRGDGRGAGKLVARPRPGPPPTLPARA